MQHSENGANAVAQAQQFLVRMIIDPEYREQVRAGGGQFATDLGGGADMRAIADRVSFDQLERFNDIVRGTRYVSLLQKYAQVGQKIGEEKLQALVTDFLKSTVIADGRGDMDVRLFDRYCQQLHGGTYLANLVSLQTARFLAAMGGRAHWTSPVALEHRVVPLRLGLPLEALEEQETGWEDQAPDEPSYYVVMPHEGEIAIHEIDEDSFELLKAIEILNLRKDASTLSKVLEENRELLTDAAEEGIVRL